uniref:probable long-chain-alcohol O-fatty-acyltransferase 5 n=1 Tax=Erigeron canadensis TaxID=72917 RepID=UPI001CB8A02D|nr:probable long-chain-alcohol O-fatty-acyltransferase 5 [Erigeron canadensis]
MESEAKNLVIYITSIITSLTYSYYISSKIPKGIYRFLSLIPIFYLFTILPLGFSFVFTTALSASFTTWLTNFKLIRFAFDLDPSPFHPSQSLLQFITFTSLPIKLPDAINPTTSHKNITTQSRQKQDTENSETRHKDQLSILKLIIHIAIFAILANIVLNYGDNFISIHYVLVIYCVMLYLIIDIISVSISVLFFLLTGLELEQPSNDPYFATSLQDFWARWNLMVTNTLRHTIYKPVRIALSGYKWAPLAGVVASFIVSGIMHELFLYQLSREPPTWEMTMFFVLHGICVVVEMVVKRMVNGGRRLPPVLGTVLTMGFVLATGFWLFFPPLIRSRVDVKIFQEYTSAVDFVKAKLFVF